MLSHFLWLFSKRVMTRVFYNMEFTSLNSLLHGLAIAQGRVIVFFSPYEQRISNNFF